MTQHGAYGYCHDCASPKAPAVGKHPAIFDGQVWVCSCGTTAVEVVEHLLTHGVPIAVLESVPHLEIATANLHAKLHDSHGLIWWRKAS